MPTILFTPTDMNTGCLHVIIITKAKICYRQVLSQLKAFLVPQGGSEPRFSYLCLIFGTVWFTKYQLHCIAHLG